MAISTAKKHNNNTTTNNNPNAFSSKRWRPPMKTFATTGSFLLLLLLALGPTSEIVQAFQPQPTKTTTTRIPFIRSSSSSSSNSYYSSLSHAYGYPPFSPSSRVVASSRLQVSSTEQSTDTADTAAADVDLESLKGDDGIYEIVDKDQHKAFLQEHDDKLVILKVYAPWCRACAGLAPKYQQISKEDSYADLPMKFTSMSIQNNKDYIKSIGVLALPTVQFYKRGKLVDNFPCGPSKVPILKKKLADLVSNSIDSTTQQLKPPSGVEKELVTPKPAGTAPVSTADGDEAQKTEEQGRQYLTTEQIQHIRTKVPFFEHLSDQDFDLALRSAKILTFDAGSTIMREGNFGRTFYVMLDGEVEICQKTAFEDPLIAPSDYVGTVINRLTGGDYFGERALITGEPRAASIRVTEPMRCVAFQKEDLPAACVLSGLSSSLTNTTEGSSYAGPNAEIVDAVNEKYGVSMRELDQMETSRQIQESSLINQKRGSALTPQAIPGVDTDEEIEYDDMAEEAEDPSMVQFKEKTASIIPLLEKFKLIRLVARCYNYIVDNRAKWGDPATLRRRSLLVSRLPRSQREEFVEAFKLVDSNGDGGINMLELKRVMEMIGEETSEDDLKEMIPTGYQSGSDGEDVMKLQDFMGIMAEVEFYYLFRDIFASLDRRDVGFVKAADLDRILCGVRDLISDDQHSIIDVEDKEMMIDYEQFTRMLLGISL